MIRKVLAFTFFGVATAGVLSVHAQQFKSHTLGDLWPDLEAQYPGVHAQKANTEAARLREQVTKANQLPQVKAQAQNTYGSFESSPGGFFPQPGFFNVSGPQQVLPGNSAAAYSFASATVEWDVFSFGKLQKEKHAAEALTQKAKSTSRAYLLQLKNDLSRRYIGLLYSQAKHRWTRTNARRLDSIGQISGGLSSAGLRPAADSLLASSSHVQALGEVDKWKGLQQEALFLLIELTGPQPINTQASTQRFIDPRTYPMQAEDTLNPAHPALEAMDHQTRYYTLQGEAVQRQALPSLKLLGGYSVRGTGIDPAGGVSGRWEDGFNHTANNVLAGIGLTWDLTGIHTSGLRARELSQEAEQASLERSQYERQMQTNLSSIRARTRQQYQQIQKTRQAVEQTHQAYRQYLARYQSGLIDLTQLLQIQDLLQQAENHHIEAAREYWTLLAGEAELTADFSFLFNNL